MYFFVVLCPNGDTSKLPVSYNSNEDPNDIKLIGLFNQLVDGEAVEVVDHYGFSINSPIHPETVPKFNTLDELTLRMSQVITDFTNINTTIIAKYEPVQDNTARSFMFGIEIEKGFEHDVSFSPTVSMGDFSSINVEDSSLVVTGSILLSNEFGVILGPDDTQGLKVVGELQEANCTISNMNLDFDIILHGDDQVPVVHNISVDMPSVKFVKLSLPKTDGKYNSFCHNNKFC